MRVINLWTVTVLALSLSVPGRAQDFDDFDFDALFDMGETEPVAEEAQPAVPAEDDPFLGFDEPVEDIPVEEPAPFEEPAAAEEPEDDFFFDFDEPVEPAPIEEPAPAEEPEDDFFSDFDDLPAEPVAEDDVAPAMEDDFFFDFDEPDAMPVEEPADAPMDDFLFDFDDPVEADPVEAPPAVEEPMEDDVEVDEVAPVAVDEPVAPRDDVAAGIAAEEEVRRQAAEINGLQNLDAGFRNLDRQEYTRARQAFEVALRDIPVRPATAEIRERASWGLAEAHFRMASDIYAADGDLRAARQNLDRAAELSPNHRGLATLQRRIAREEARRVAEQARPVPVERRPEVVEKRETVADLMQEGIALYNAGELNRAEDVFEAILIRDEYNTDAMRYLRRITEDRMRASTRLRETTTAQMMQDVRDAWNPPLRDEVDLPDRLAETEATDLMTDARRLQEKMESIIIPRIEFRQANVRDVFNFLRDASEAADPEGEGVNIILNLNVPEGAAAETRAPPADDPWGQADDPWAAVAAAPEPAGMAGVGSITLNLRRISLMEAIRYITEVAGLRYRIERTAVVITPAGVADLSRVITRLYPVQPSFLDVVGERTDAAPAAGFGEFQEFGTRRAPTTRAGDVKQFFESAGVPFPVGTSITYNPTISQLIVANTPENLDRFERILSQLNIVPNQVEIEARFVEIAEEDMRELGLQWLFTDNYEFAMRQGGGPLGGRERVQIDAGQPTRGLRHFGSTESGTVPTSVGMTADPNFIGNILSVSSILTNPELRVVLHALSQNGNVDVLSAPRVTTRSGMNATIEVVQELIYPTEFRQEISETEIFNPDTGRTERRSFVNVTPENFETRKVGVILNVTPTVGPDGYTIDLALAPEVAELTDWIQYGSVRLGEVINIPQPLFSSRNVTTSIVIWDGQTVVMGGLMRERLVSFNDKIPLLGDIPILGRLFRSEGQRSRKENLLIFVTARLVDPAGKPIHQAGVPGVPGPATMVE